MVPAKAQYHPARAKCRRETGKQYSGQSCASAVPASRGEPASTGLLGPSPVWSVTRRTAPFSNWPAISKIMVDCRTKRIDSGLRLLEIGVGDPHRQRIGGRFVGRQQFFGIGTFHGVAVLAVDDLASFATAISFLRSEASIGHRLTKSLAVLIYERISPNHEKPS